MQNLIKVELTFDGSSSLSQIDLTANLVEEARRLGCRARNLPHDVEVELAERIAYHAIYNVKRLLHIKFAQAVELVLARHQRQVEAEDAFIRKMQEEDSNA